VHGNALWTYQCPGHVSRYDESHLKDVLDEGVIVYIVDVLIYAKTEEKHDLLVKKVLKRLAENELVISPEKCTWSTEKVEFLGYILTPDGMEMLQDKIVAIKEWQLPKS
jgi:hypothetical protein